MLPSPPCEPPTMSLLNQAWIGRFCALAALAWAAAPISPCSSPATVTNTRVASNSIPLSAKTRASSIDSTVPRRADAARRGGRVRQRIPRAEAHELREQLLQAVLGNRAEQRDDARIDCPRLRGRLRLRARAGVHRHQHGKGNSCDSFHVEHR